MDNLRNELLNELYVQYAQECRVDHAETKAFQDWYETEGKDQLLEAVFNRLTSVEKRFGELMAAVENWNTVAESDASMDEAIMASDRLVETWARYVGKS